MTSDASGASHASAVATTDSSASRGGRGARSRRVRATAAAVALAGALALTACSGDASDDADGPATPGPSVTASADTGGTQDPGGSKAPAGELEGSWVTTAGGSAVALMITGQDAALFVTGGSVCTGTAREDSGNRSISLKCTDGTGERTKGTVESVDETSLKVTWEGGLGTETYMKAEGGRLPTDFPFPTAGLGL